MKELTIKEKAKAYDEALETARKINSGEGVAAPPGWTVCEVIFPELKESEDERIRKHIIEVFRDHFNGEDCDKCIAWLEKQKTSEEALQYLRENHSPSEVSDFQAVMNIAVAKAYDKGYNDALKKQGEQKPVDVRTTGYWHVEDVEQKPAEEYNITGISSNKSQGKLGEIIKNLKTTWSEEDENYHRICLDLCTGMPNGGVYAPYIKDEAINWLKSIKDRVQPQQEWSEKDKNLFKCAIDAVKQESKVRTDGCLDEEVGEKVINWLKSIKERYTWKPSDEQMKLLKELVEDNNQRHFYTILKSLYDQLKKLKG